MTATKSSHPDFFFTSLCLILPQDNKVFVWLAGKPDQQQMQIKTTSAHVQPGWIEHRAVPWSGSACAGCQEVRNEQAGLLLLLAVPV